MVWGEGRGDLDNDRWCGCRCRCVNYEYEKKDAKKVLSTTSTLMLIFKKVRKARVKANGGARKATSGETSCWLVKHRGMGKLGVRGDDIETPTKKEKAT